LEPYGIDYDAFTLTSAARCAEILAGASVVRAFVGEPSNTPSPSDGDALLGFWAGPAGLVVAAESVRVFNFQGELEPDAVITSNSKWWEYWREYWRRKDSSDPLPRDFACEVTIPAGSQ
jgi:hypothetical protein